MKITEVETIHLRLPTIAEECNGTQDALLVKITPIPGWSASARWTPRRSRQGGLRRALLAHAGVRAAPSAGRRRPARHRAAVGEDVPGTIYFGRRGAAVHAISGADIALWDLLGKATGMPVYQLLGGAYHKRMPAYSSDLMPFDADEAASRAAFLRDAGFRAFQVRLGRRLGKSEAQDVALVGAVRKGARRRGGTDDRHRPLLGLLPPPSARARRWRSSACTWIEEPLPPDDLAGYARLADAVDDADRGGRGESATCWEFADLMDRGRIDVVQVDVSRAGGLTESPPHRADGASAQPAMRPARLQHGRPAGGEPALGRLHPERLAGRVHRRGVAAGHGLTGTACCASRSARAMAGSPFPMAPASASNWMKSRSRNIASH